MFKIGDRVRIVTTNDFTYNDRLGIVCSIYDGGYGVLLDGETLAKVFATSFLIHGEIPPAEKDLWNFHEWMEKNSQENTEQPTADNGKAHDPMNVKTRAEWNFERMQALAEGIKSYMENSYVIPTEWFEEYNELASIDRSIKGE